MVQDICFLFLKILVILYLLYDIYVLISNFKKATKRIDRVKNIFFINCIICDTTIDYLSFYTI